MEPQSDLDLKAGPQTTIVEMSIVPTVHDTEKIELQTEKDLEAGTRPKLDWDRPFEKSVL